MGKIISINAQFSNTDQISTDVNHWSNIITNLPICAYAKSGSAVGTTVNATPTYGGLVYIASNETIIRFVKSPEHHNPYGTTINIIYFTK